MGSTTRTIRLLLCDDHEIFTQSLAFTLDAEGDLDVCATATSIEAAKLLFDRSPDVAIIDVRLVGEDGTALVRWITDNHPSCRTVVLTAFESDETFLSAYEAGAGAFVIKSTSCDHLISVIRDLVAGYQLITPEYAEAAKVRISNRQLNRFEQLSASDQKLIALIAQGLPDRQIAAEMHLSLQTIRNRVSRLLHLFELTNRTQLALFASQHGS